MLAADCFNWLCPWEGIETTPWHLFYTDEGWVEAGDLEAGDLLLSLGGVYGEVESILIEERTETMYDLTIEEVHTFAVGDGDWVVHNQNVEICEIADAIRWENDGGNNVPGRYSSAYRFATPSFRGSLIPKYALNSSDNMSTLRRFSASQFNRYFAGGLTDIHTGLDLSKLRERVLRGEWQYRFDLLWDPNSVSSLVEFHAHGRLESSPFLSLTNNVLGTANTYDELNLRPIIYEKATHIAEFAFPSDVRLYRPRWQVARLEGELLWYGLGVEKYLTRWSPNQFLNTQP